MRFAQSSHSSPCPRSDFRWPVERFRFRPEALKASATSRAPGWCIEIVLTRSLKRPASPSFASLLIIHDRKLGRPKSNHHSSWVVGRYPPTPSTASLIITNITGRLHCTVAFIPFALCRNPNFTRSHNLKPLLAASFCPSSTLIRRWSNGGKRLAYGDGSYDVSTDCAGKSTVATNISPSPVQYLKACAAAWVALDAGKNQKHCLLSGAAKASQFRVKQILNLTVVVFASGWARLIASNPWENSR